MAHGTTAAVSNVRIEKNKRGYSKLWDYFSFLVDSNKKKLFVTYVTSHHHTLVIQQI